MDTPQNTSSNRYTNLFYARLKEIYSYQSIVDFDLDELTSQVRFFEQSSIHDDTLIIILDLRNYHPLYVSKNISKIWSGFDRDEIMKNGFISKFDTIVPEHIQFPLMSVEWYRKSKENVPIHILRSSTKIYHCGLNMHFDGEISTFLLRNVLVAFDQKNRPIISMLYINNINHLFKGEFFWGRHTFGEKNEYTVFHTTAETNKLEYSDIISPREKEVLLRIASNKDSKQIAKELNISISTVEKHRKNMLARSGAKDSTALIQLCKMCGVV